jgi:hypothetical protein
MRAWDAACGGMRPPTKGGRNEPKIQLKPFPAQRRFRVSLSALLEHCSLHRRSIAIAVAARLALRHSEVETVGQVARRATLMAHGEHGG